MGIFQTRVPFGLKYACTGTFVYSLPCEIPRGIVFPMTVNIEVTRNGTENNMSVIRRFSRRVMDAGIIIGVKARRYAKRAESANTKRRNKLKRLTRKAEVEKLIKLGKMQPRG
jgi:hypothetical protein